jgi:phosphoglycolate phosphatase-like HAD superfamily hydrolase
MTAMHAAIFTGPIEFRPGFTPPVRAKHVMFDFDGTLSLIRQGWSELMLDLFLELMPGRRGDRPEELRALLRDDIVALTGKPTIHQMQRFADRIAERGGRPQEASWYHTRFQKRLARCIADRLKALRAGEVNRDHLMVYGSRRLLEALKARGLVLHLASGTEEAAVRREADLLGIADYFEGRIHGPRDDGTTFSKAAVVDAIVRDHGLVGEGLLAFGDGPVEIAETKRVGGSAVAVASDEARNGCGLMDPTKRASLFGVGADVCVPDYHDAEALVEMLLGAP